MLSVTDAQLEIWLAAFFFPLARVFGLMATAPVFNNASLPMRVKLIAGLAVTLALARPCRRCRRSPRLPGPDWPYSSSRA